METICESSDLIVFSHLRWDFVFQRPQHLMSRFAKYRRVFYFEEPIFQMIDFPKLEIKEKNYVKIVVPHLPSNIDHKEIEQTLMELVDDLVFTHKMENYSTWYYTPMALNFTRHLNPKSVLFDCMDELSMFKNAPQSLIELEHELMQKANIVFTGGESLYQAKKHRHHNIHAFPSSIDYEHFAKARTSHRDPEDQKDIAHPRIGFYGVIDERFDIQLLKEMAEMKPDYQFIVIGPVVKIDPESLPRRENIHYLGKKDYEELPTYLSGWDCAMMPFALNDSTKFISPTKTPEFLASGRPVVSTAINDVVHPYHDEGLTHIAHDAKSFIKCIDMAMAEKKETESWTRKVDSFLMKNSWEKTWKRMALLEKEIHSKKSETRQQQTDKNYFVLNEAQ